MVKACTTHVEVNYIEYQARARATEVFVLSRKDLAVEVFGWLPYPV